MAVNGVVDLFNLGTQFQLFFLSLFYSWALNFFAINKNIKCCIDTVGMTAYLMGYWFI